MAAKTPGAITRAAASRCHGKLLGCLILAEAYACSVAL